MDVFHARDRAVQRDLHVDGQARRHALHIHLVRVQPLRLQKELVPLLIGEFHHLVLDRRTVARPDALDHPAVKRAAVDIFPDNFVRLFIRIGKVAGNLLPLDFPAQKGERNDCFVAVLRLCFGKINAARVHPRGRSRFEPLQGKAKGRKARAQIISREEAARSRAFRIFSDDHLSLQVNARRKDHRAGIIARAHRAAHAAYAAPVRQDVRRFVLHKQQVFRIFQRLFHIPLIELLILLRPQRVHRRAFFCIQHLDLDERCIRRKPHLSAQRVDLAYKMALCRSSDRRIARHQRDAVHIDGHKQGLFPHASTCERRLDARMARAYNDDVIRSA